MIYQIHHLLYSLQNTPNTPEQMCEPRFKQRSDTTTNAHVEWLATRGGDVSTILVGTSMFERFSYTKEGMKAWSSHGLNDSIFNCGVGGDRIENILYRLETRRVLEAVPVAGVTTVILLAGANDVEKGNVPHMIAGMSRIIAVIRESFPSAILHVLGMYPRRSKKKSEELILERTRDFNSQLEKLGGEFHNFGDDVMRADNTVDPEFFTDLVHFNDAGYDRFAQHIRDLCKPTIKS